MIWVVVKIMVPFWGTLNIRGRIIIGIQKRDHNCDNHPYVSTDHRALIRKISPKTVLFVRHPPVDT